MTAARPRLRNKPAIDHERARDASDEERDAMFAPGNDRIWGEGNWVRCSTCPHDANDREVYHHRDAHLRAAP